VNVETGKLDLEINVKCPR